MQTFLPHPDFRRSIAALDSRRLGKQRVEARQILNAICKTNGWSNHPAVRMWRGWEQALTYYGNLAILEWIERSYKNTMPLIRVPDSFPFPPWVGNTDFHLSHQSNLVRKNPDHYRPQFPDVPDNLPYVWPL